MKSLRTRVLEPELLDELPIDDPQARRSRRDLRRVNRFMGSRAVLLRGLQRARAVRDQAAQGRGRDTAMPNGASERWLELGAGDGTLLLRLAATLARRTPRGASAEPPGVQLSLLDRQALLEPATCEAYRRLGWQVQPLTMDVRAWAGSPVSTAAALRGHYEVIVTNLFLHHFDDEALRLLLAAVAARCDCFLACEPRRAPLALVGSHLMGVIGANAVTRHDAVLSVRAGFRDQELSALWPASGWRLEEQAAGLFAHALFAWRAAA